MTYCLGMENPFKMTIISHLNQIKFGESFNVFQYYHYSNDASDSWHLKFVAPRAQACDLFFSVSWLILGDLILL